ncbi:MAG: CdaR family protein [Myxococcota bacterium]|nr:CdaR family protein [Myxococcota bacterium]
MDVGYQVRSLVTENLSLKVLSVAFALGLYSLVHGSQDAQRSVLLNVVALTPPSSSNRVLMTPIPAQIRVTLRGPRSTLDDLHADDMGSVQLDLRDRDESRVVIGASLIPISPGLKVEQIEPPAIDLVWEDVVVREINVQVGVVGTPASGFTIKAAPVADPAAVRARGPKSEVTVMQRARADAFDVTGLTEGKYTRQLAIDRPPGHVTLDVPSVAATVEIGREVVERLFTRVPVAVIGHAGAKPQPAEVDVRLACPSEVVRSLRAEQLVPRVQVPPVAEHGSDALPVLLPLDQCEVHVTPPNIIVRW